MDTKNYMLIIILTLVLGYFLGLMISSTVDNRLKDLVVNLPRPKNNIIVNQKPVKKKSQKKIKKNKVKSSKIKNLLTNDLFDSKNSDNTLNRIEHFTNKINDIAKNINQNKKNVNNEFNHILVDKNIDTYSRLFKESLSDNSKYNNTKLKAYNNEDSDQNYSSITNK